VINRSREGYLFSNQATRPGDQESDAIIEEVERETEKRRRETAREKREDGPRADPAHGTDTTSSSWHSCPVKKDVGASSLAELEKIIIDDRVTPGARG
jgi:hypothetical protein